MVRTKMCFDRVLPASLRRPEAMVRNAEDKRTRAMFVLKTLWPHNTKLRVRFLGGAAKQQKDVRTFAEGWDEHMNLSFEWGDAPDAEIRISFEDDGAWSYVGTDCLGIPRNAATMNFGWLDEAVVLHEFGHALGLAHEHQNPAGGLEWVPEVVYRDLAGSPNFWTRDQVDHNVLSKYATTQINGSAFDEKSIMLYSFPPSWTKSGFSGGDNPTLSPTDIDFMNKTYPKDKAPTITELVVAETKATAAELGAFGEEDLFQFTAKDAGRYTIETMGPTDVVMSLYGPNSKTARIAQDDDGGDGHNAKIVADLTKGTHYVQVRHYNPTNGKGQYEIRVTK